MGFSPASHRSAQLDTADDDIEVAALLGEGYSTRTARGTPCEGRCPRLQFLQAFCQHAVAEAGHGVAEFREPVIPL
jgi:hypothetical protein